MHSHPLCSLLSSLTPHPTTPSLLAHHLHTLLSPAPAEHQLLHHNQYYTQCLDDLAEDILYSVYMHGRTRRQALPSCLIGYYEVGKRIIHGQGVPQQLRSFAQSRLLSLLMSEAPLAYVKSSIDVLQPTPLTQTFLAQLATLLHSRSMHIFALYGLPPLTTSLLHSYFLNHLLQTSKQQDLFLPIDMVLLCLIYASLKSTGSRMLFGTVVDVYEKNYISHIERAVLLQYYNRVFIIRLLPMQLLESIKSDSKVKDQQQSLLDMFQ